MKIETKYICEICGEDWYIPFFAKVCEDSHREKTTKIEYEYNKSSIFPKKVIVTFEGGNVKTYYEAR